MDEQRTAEIHTILSKSAFGYGLAKDAVRFLSFIESKGIRLDELTELFTKIDEAQRQRTLQGQATRMAIKRNSPRCPSCGGELRLNAGDDNDSHWTCVKCRHGIYNPEPAEVVIKKLLEKEDKRDATR